MIKFNVTIYIPMQGHEWCDVVEEVEELFCQRAGGMTAQDVLGGYVMADGSTCFEPVRTVSMIVDDWADLDTHRQFMNDIADNVKERLEQESVLWTAAPAGMVVFR